MKKNVVLVMIISLFLASCATQRVATTTANKNSISYVFNGKTQKLEPRQTNLSETPVSEEGMFHKFETNAKGDTVRTEDWKVFDGERIIIKEKYIEKGAEVTITWRYNDVESFNDLELKELKYDVVYGDKKSLTSEWVLPPYTDPTGPFKMKKATDLNVGFLETFDALTDLLVFCEKEKSQILKIPESVQKYIAKERDETLERGEVDCTVTKVVAKDSITTTSKEVGVYEVRTPTLEGISRNQQGLVGKRYISGTKVDRRIDYEINLEWIGEGEDVIANGDILINGVKIPIKCKRNGRTFTQILTIDGEEYTWTRVQ